MTYPKSPKFLPGQKVWVEVGHTKSMLHFATKFYALIRGSYGMLYGGPDHDDWDVCMLDDSGRIVNEIAWYHTDQLTLVKGFNRFKGYELIEAFDLERHSDD